MGLANWLTVLRIVLIPLFVLLLLYKRPGLALVVFASAALTDLLDGYVARRRGSQTRLGAFLDPMADKLLLTAAFVTLTHLRVLPAWITVVVISRDVILMMGALLIHMLGGRIYPRPTWAGKAATFFQILAVLAGMMARYFRPWGPSAMVLSSFVWLAAIFTIVSGLQYLVQGMRYLSATDAAREETSESVFFR
jgi:cardiolipin synthase